MCGIAGILTSVALESRVSVALGAMTGAQRHRGPDDSGHFVGAFGQVIAGLGHRRLSILDLSPLGHQPMADAATGNVLVFNGEIYNFRALRTQLESDGDRFTSTGDTEVLLKGLLRYGEAFLPRLQGMFAFGYLDRAKRELLLARDAMGIKPLYLAATADTIVFASEVRAVLASGMVDTALDPLGLGGLLAYGAMQQPHTIFKSVRSLLPGRYAKVPLAAPLAVNEQPFWRFPPVDRSLVEPVVVPRVRELLDAAVRDHLESDVPVGVFLSSGIDSTLIAGLAQRHTSRLKTFTVGFADHPDLSEIALAGETARQMRFDHTEIVINSADAENAARQWLGALDVPSVDGLNVFAISQFVRARGITVALSGQGGDELFGGYPSFVDVPRLNKMIGRVRWMPGPVRDLVARAISSRRPLAYREKLRDMLASDGDVRSLYLHRRRLMSNDQLAELGVAPGVLAAVQHVSPEIEELLAVLDNDAVASISRMESMLYQGNMLLRDGDTNGMCHGLELRVPLLDQRVIDYVHRIPGDVRLPPGGRPKHLLRKAFPELLRAELLDQPKRGFTLPVRRWMLGPLRDLCESAIDSLVHETTLDARGVRAVWAAFLKEPESPIWTRAFMLCVLGDYLRRVRNAA